MVTQMVTQNLMTPPSVTVETVPQSERIILRTDDGPEKVLSIEEALALRSGLTRAVHLARKPQPCKYPMFDRMDDVWIYIPLGENSLSCVEIIGRRNGVYISAVIDSLGMSPMFFSGTRPGTAGLKPYLMLKDLDAAMPFLLTFRQAYRDKFLEDAGLSGDSLSRERFVEAAEAPGGGILFISESLCKGDRMQQTVRLVDIAHGRNSRRYYYSDDANYPYTIRPDLKRIPAEEAVAIVSDAATSWFDLLIELVRPWFGDDAEGCRWDTR